MSFLRITLASVCCAGISIAFAGTSGGQEAEGDSSANNVIELIENGYPRHIEIPADIPPVMIADGSKDPSDEEVMVYLPPVLYLTGHYEGWQLCLWECKENGFAGLRSEDAAWLNFRQSNESYTDVGEKAGYFACLELLKGLSEGGVEETEIREACGEAYMPLEPF